MKYSNTEEGISDRMNSKWIWITLTLVAATMVAGCVGVKNGQINGNDGGERMFIEGYLRITNPITGKK